MPEENFYELLRVRPTAGPRVIQAAYRRLILLHHPDRNPGVDALEMTQRLNRAYEVLSDPERRADYDRELSDRAGATAEGAIEQGNGQSPHRPPTSGPGPGVWRIGGLPRPVWLAGGGAVVVITVIVIIVVALMGAGDSTGGNQTLLVAEPRPTPNLTPPIIPSPTAKITVSVATPSPTFAPSASFHFDNGAEYIKNGNFDQAIKEFTIAINLIPNYVYGYRVRGFSYFQIGQYHQAIGDFDIAIQLDPNDKSSYNDRGIAYYQIGQYRLAIEDFDKAIRLDPEFAFAFSRRGLANDQLQRFELAKLDAERACFLDSQFCSSLASVAATSTPAAAAVPRPSTPIATSGPRRENFIIVSSTIALESKATLKSP